MRNSMDPRDVRLLVTIIVKVYAKLRFSYHADVPLVCEHRSWLPAIQTLIGISSPHCTHEKHPKRNNDRHTKANKIFKKSRV